MTYILFETVRADDLLVEIHKPREKNSSRAMFLSEESVRVALGYVMLGSAYDTTDTCVLSSEKIETLPLLLLLASQY